MLYVKKRTLLLIAGLVWLIAGVNVARLGIISYMKVEQKWYVYVLTVVIFFAFGMMFYRINEKNTKRIMSYEENRPFYCFFDLKGYVIMIFMMSMGIGLRAAGLFSDMFIAFFYFGLGCALASSGLLYLKKYIGNLTN